MIDTFARPSALESHQDRSTCDSFQVRLVYKIEIQNNSCSHTLNGEFRCLTRAAPPRMPVPTLARLYDRYLCVFELNEALEQGTAIFGVERRDLLVDLSRPSIDIDRPEIQLTRR